jgi:hypothetical protein
MRGRRRPSSLLAPRGASALVFAALALALAACGGDDAGSGGQVTGGTSAGGGASGGGGSSPDAGSGGQVTGGTPVTDLGTIPDATPPDAGPPSLCHPTPAGGATFTDASEGFGLRGPGAPEAGIEGGRLSAGDLDHDGYPDLIVHKGGANTPVDPALPLPYAVLMNRPGADGARRFEDHTQASGYATSLLDRPDRVAHFALFGDVDNDGDTDILSAVYTDASGDTGQRAAVLLNDGTATFTHARPSDLQPGRANPPATTSATLLDFDRDGFLDIWMGHGYGEFGNLGETQQDRLYKGRGDGKFDDVTEAAGLETRSPLSGGGLDFEALNAGLAHKPTYGVGACDLDGDGDQDLLSVSYGRQMNMLWVNRNARFENQSIPSGFAADDNLDFSDNQFYRCHCRLTGDCEAPAPGIQCSQDLWNTGVDDQPFRLGGNTFSVTCADVDDDGRPDVLTGTIKHWHIGDSSDASTLLHNTSEADRVRLERRPNAELGLQRDWPIPDWNEGDIFSAIFDFDLDGRKDVYWGSTDYPATRAFLYRQLPDGTFEEVGETVGLSHERAAGLALADVDRDGDLDVFVGSSTARCSANDNPPCPWTMSGPDVYLYLNDAAAKNNWVALDLDASGLNANRLGIGARVAVTAGGRTQFYEVQAGHGHFGQQDTHTLHVGLGTACAIDRVEVRWPDRANTVTVHTGLRANTFVTLVGDGGTRETHAPGEAQ